jgi:hypothetical protein
MGPDLPELPALAFYRDLLAWKPPPGTSTLVGRESKAGASNVAAAQALKIRIFGALPPIEFRTKLPIKGGKGDAHPGARGQRLSRE